jgi:hypothetical protein
MLLAILAAALVAIASPDAGATGHNETPANWYKKPSGEQIHAVWPLKALNSRGKAIINCGVNIHGLAEDCIVVSEDPPGDGFGTAALLLTPDFLFSPATIDGSPVSSRVVIPINFERPPGRPSDRSRPATFTLIEHPVWAAAPGFADLAVAYPKGGGGIAGYVGLRCGVRRTGELNHCEILREEPTGRGFGGAARDLSQKFRVALDPETLAARTAIQVNLPVRFVDPASADFIHRRLGQPIWIQTVDQTTTQELFPAEAASRGLKTGLGVVDCAVSANGALTDCKPLPADPEGAGFSEAAVRVAQVMKMSLWTQEGGPVDGARVKLPVRFDLASATTASR